MSCGHSSSESQQMRTWALAFLEETRELYHGPGIAELNECRSAMGFGLYRPFVSVRR